MQIDKTPRMVIQSNPTTLFRYHFQVTNFFTKQLGMGRFECGVGLMADWGTPAITESDRLVADIVSPIWHDQRGATGRATPLLVRRLGECPHLCETVKMDDSILSR